LNDFIYRCRYCFENKKWCKQWDGSFKLCNADGTEHRCSKMFAVKFLEFQKDSAIRLKQYETLRSLLNEQCQR